MHSLNSSRSPSYTHLWWLNPIFPLSFMLLLTGISAYIIPSADFVENWKAPKYFGDDDLKFIIGAVLCFGICASFIALIGDRKPCSFSSIFSPQVETPWILLKVFFFGAFFVTILAYLIWLTAGVANGLSFSDISRTLHHDPDAAYLIREKTETVPGVTTFTQLEMGLCLLGIILLFKGGWRSTWRTIGLPMAFLFILVYIRSSFRTERLALIEIAIPSAILIIALLRTEKWPLWGRLLCGMAPLAAPLFLYAFFSAAEYSRSWINFYQDKQESSFLWFSFMRLAGYYVTALNNGAAFVQTIGQYAIPFHSLEWFWKFPIIKTVFRYQTLSHAEPWDDYGDLLKQKLNPELNNPSGVFVIELDYGWVGGLLIWCVLGVIAMLLYRSFKKGNILGLMMYPFFYIGLLESPRVLYWTQSRALPTWIFIWAVVLITFLMNKAEWYRFRLLRFSRGHTKSKRPHESVFIKKKKRTLRRTL